MTEKQYTDLNRRLLALERGTRTVGGGGGGGGGVPTSRQVIAGTGLAGGGTLAADRTFNIGAGTGITVNADDVALDITSTRNTDHAGVTLTAGAGLTGGGDITASRTFDVGAGDAIDVAADVINVKVDGVTVIVNGSNELEAVGVGGGSPGSVGGPVSVSLLTSGTGATYTVPAGITRLWVRVVGGGGGGGGGDQSVSGPGAGAGGGAGGYGERVEMTTPGATFTYTVGAAGPGGTAGNNAGTAGGTTTWDIAGSPVAALGGGAGGSMAAGTGLAAAAGGGGGTCSGGDINSTGQAGAQSIRWNTTQFLEGIGGSASPLGAGGAFKTSGQGEHATGFGSGGAGGSEFLGSTDRAGGNGSAGVIIVYEYD